MHRHPVVREGQVHVHGAVLLLLSVLEAVHLHAAAAGESERLVGVVVLSTDTWPPPCFCMACCISCCRSWDPCGGRNNRDAERTMGRTHGGSVGTRKLGGPGNPSDHPPFIVSLRSAMPASSSLWVTIRRSAQVPSAVRRRCTVHGHARCPGCHWVHRPAPRWLLKSARATATRCCSPPLSWFGLCSARAATFRRSSSSWARGRHASRSRPAIDPGIITFSSAVNSGSRWWNWNTKPMCVFRKVLNARWRACPPRCRRCAGCPGRPVPAFRGSAAGWSCRPRWRHDAHHLAGLHAQVHALQHLQVAVPFVDAPRFIMRQRKHRGLSVTGLIFAPSQRNPP